MKKKITISITKDKKGVEQFNAINDGLSIYEVITLLEWAKLKAIEKLTEIQNP